MPEVSLSHSDNGIAPGFDPQDIFDNAPIGIFTSTPEGRYISVNPALARMYGYDSPEELIESVTDIATQVYADSEDRHEFMRLMQEHGKVVEHETRFKRKVGSVFWVSRSVQAVFDNQGNMLQYQGISTDITEIKQAEQALRREDADRRRILVDQSRDGIVVLNQDGSVHEANKRYAEMLGYTHEEVLQLNVWDWDKQWSRDQLIEMIQQVDAEGDHFETRHQRKDGTFLEVEISTNGAVIGERKLVFCVCRDITVRKRAEYENAKSREMLLQAEILAKLGCLEWDIPNDTWFVSDNWRRIMGHDSPRLSSPELFAYVHPEDRRRVKRAIATTMRTGKPYAIQHRILRGDTGEVRHVQTYGVLELNKPGKPVRGFGTIQDITDRKQAEEKIRITNEQLQIANAEKDKLFAIIAHDLKSPMCGLVASTKFLANQPDIFSDEDIRLLQTELHKNAKNTFELLEDLLQWSRMSQGGIDYAPTPYSLNDLLNMGLSTAQGLAKSKGISLRQDTPQGLTVLVDQPMIKTVIRNILFNAIKFTPRGGEIAVSAKQERPTATVAIQDTGVGMNEHVLSSIFTLEKEKRQLGTEGEKGTGLGLMLCKQFIEKHGGQIWAESEPGKGTTVFFTLPVSD